MLISLIQELLICNTFLFVPHRRNVDCGEKDDTESEEEETKGDTSSSDSNNAIDNDTKVEGKRGGDGGGDITFGL